MKKELYKKGVYGYIGIYTPRKNQYEKGLKYVLVIGDRPTQYKFCTMHETKTFFEKNYFIWL